MSPSEITIMYIIKTHFLATIFAFFGGVAHAIQNVKKSGWKGWISFLCDIVVCIFFGNVFYQIGLIIKPEYAIVLTSLGSFWGAKSFDYIRDWVLNSLKANIK